MNHNVSCAWGHLVTCHSRPLVEVTIAKEKPQMSDVNATAIQIPAVWTIAKVHLLEASKSKCSTSRHRCHLELEDVIHVDTPIQDLSIWPDSSAHRFKTEERTSKQRLRLQEQDEW